MEIEFSVEYFLAGSLALLVWKLLGFLKISYWLVAAPILLWFFIPYVLICILFLLWGIHVAVKVIGISTYVAVLWTVAVITDKLDELKMKRVDKKATKELDKWGIK